MITAGYMGAVSVVTTVKWFWFLIGLAALFAVIVHFAQVFKAYADAKGGELSQLYGKLAWLSILVALMSARYRDLGQLISQLMGFFLFVTPIFWVPSAVSGFRSAYVLYNPFAHFLEIVRAPLMGEAPAGISIAVCSALAVIGWIVAVFALIRHQRKVVFWI